LQHIAALLKPGGAVYIEVPDASQYDRWFSAPFQFFSLEHINYFAPQSLTNLLARHAFVPAFVRRVARYLSPKAGEPAVGGLFRSADAAAAEFARDAETKAALLRYIAGSRELEDSIAKKIDALVESEKPLAVWGTGTHTLRLLETSNLGRANIIAFVDSNQNYQGKTLAGRPVLAPSALDHPSAEILISSQAAEEEIFRVIKEKLGWSNTVHRLYAG
jgi:FlaA1/EpsC-like NDP-sugar epimerase